MLLVTALAAAVTLVCGREVRSCVEEVEPLKNDANHSASGKQSALFIAGESGLHDW